MERNPTDIATMATNQRAFGQKEMHKNFYLVHLIISFKVPENEIEERNYVKHVRNH